MNGSCLCGKTTIAISGEPQMKALCHCVDCQKISGSTYSTNAIFKEDDVKSTGQAPKTFTKKSDAGRTIHSHFCADCGSTLSRTGEAFPGMVIVKAGVLDGAMEKVKPDAELFVGARPSWVSEQSGANQIPGMPS